MSGAPEPQTAQPKVRQLFGTDGIRGVAGKFPLDAVTLVSIGRALGARIGAASATPRVMIGMDTRESSSWIAHALAAGLNSKGVQVVSAGVITTPGVAFLTRTQGFDAGIVISASHNPWEDNGIKIFGRDGFKLSDDVEHEIEQDIFAHIGQSESAAIDLEATPLPESQRLHSTYVEWLASNVAHTNLRDLKVLVDCAHGATSVLAREVFAACGITAKFMHCAPDGRNINANCGALHPEIVAHAIETGAAGNDRFDVGVSFDGDGDRALFADAAAHVINGDAVLLLAAREMQARGSLAGNTVVATTMSNMGLEAALRRSAINMLRAPVGDKYVLEEMKNSGATLGGEQSGHIIFLDGESTTGDGLLTALRVFQVMASTRRPLADLVSDLHVFPQVIKNIRVREKRPFAELPAVAGAIEAAQRELGEDGRVVVRYSGTEALARVMVEAANREQMQRVADAIAGAIQKELGA
jgi:phosphoglucosamine mutase